MKTSFTGQHQKALDNHATMPDDSRVAGLLAVLF
jgi:hypothetical protein